MTNTIASTAARIASSAGTGEAGRSSVVSALDRVSSREATSSAATSSSVVTAVGSGSSQPLAFTSLSMSTPSGTAGVAHGRKAMMKARTASPTPTSSRTGNAGAGLPDRGEPGVGPWGTPYPLMDFLSEGDSVEPADTLPAYGRREASPVRG